MKAIRLQRMRFQLSLADIFSDGQFCQISDFDCVFQGVYKIRESVPESTLNGRHLETLSFDSTASSR